VSLVIICARVIIGSTCIQLQLITTPSDEQAFAQYTPARMAASFKQPLLSVDISMCVCVSVCVVNFDAKYLGN